MVQMIVAQRASEFNSKAIQTSDTMLRTAVNLKRQLDRCQVLGFRCQGFQQALRAAFEPAEGVGENGEAIVAEGETSPL